MLRNGVEIGRSRVRVPNDDFETHVMTFAGVENSRPQWIYAGVPVIRARQASPPT